MEKALITCCLNNTNGEVVRLLLKAGADINSADIKLNNALMMCCWKKPDTLKEVLVERRRAAKVLLENGIDVKAKNIEELTAIQIACINGKMIFYFFEIKFKYFTVNEEHEKITDVLVGGGADPMDVLRWMSKAKENSRNWVAGSVMKKYGKNLFPS